MKKSSRKRVGAAIETNILTLSRRRCCACFFLEGDLLLKSGQIAHLDRNPANNELDNLAYLCLDHHDSYDTTRSQSKGITVGELKHYRNELYRILGTENRTSPSTVAVEESQIRLCEATIADCAALSVSTSELVSFVLQEAHRHPLLFGSPFTSLPLVFRDNVLLLSWDFDELRLERLLNRQEAYPLNDAWTTCLTLYRRATLLPYRTKERGELVSRSEGQRAIATYRNLICETNQFLQLLSANKLVHPQTSADLSALVDEAEFALVNGENGKLVARLEAVLSTVHKLILKYAPQGPLSIEPAPMTASLIEVPKDNRPSILVVDDVNELLKAVASLLSEEGYAVTTANTTTEALRAMVNHEFDIVMTDLVMPAEVGAAPEADGREVAIAAKRASKKTKVIVFTAFMEVSRLAHLQNIGVDRVIGKPTRLRGPEGFLAIIRELLDASQPTSV